MRSLGALGVVTMLFALALFQPWGVLPGTKSDFAATETRAVGGGIQHEPDSMGLKAVRGCFGPVESAERQASPTRKRICERRGGVETRLGKVHELTLR